MDVGLFINTQFPEGFNTPERILDIVERRSPLEYKYNAYASWGLSDRRNETSFEDFARDKFIIGDKVSVKEEIALYHELLGVDRFIMRCNWPGLPQHRTMATIKRLGQIFR